MDDAMAQAKADGKSILIDFTGSDWCSWCIRLDKEVFSQSMFQTYAPEKFVLVELDFPRQTQLSDEQKAHNEKWRDTFGIGGYPTIILADENGKEFARTGYQPGGPAPYIDHLDKFLDARVIRDAALAAAEKVDGIARAKMLDWALSIEGVMVPDAETLMQEIITLDPDDLTGLKEMYERKLNDREARKSLEAIQVQAFRAGDMPGATAKMKELLDDGSRFSLDMQVELTGFYVMLLSATEKGDEALGAIDAFLAREGLEIKHRQQMAASKVDLHLSAGRFDEAIAAFDEAVAMAPDSDMGKALTQNRPRLMKMIEAQRGGVDNSIPATPLQPGGGS
jgi:thiol-disulfide isomerase/thioredoxin